MYQTLSAYLIKASKLQLHETSHGWDYEYELLIIYEMKQQII